MATLGNQGFNLLDSVQLIHRSMAGAQVPHLKYQLPSQLNMYLDLVDDEDVALMFDEWAEFVASNRVAVGQKLHVFVEWQPQRMSSEALQVGAANATGAPKPVPSENDTEKSSGQSAQMYLSNRSSEEQHSGGAAPARLSLKAERQA